jgi:MinD-like ATPase involved in chromosome partitioning or flagellar assembly
MRLFTWYDVEVELKKKRNLWPLWWNRVDVYSDEIVVNMDPEGNGKEENEETFINIFGKFYMNGSVMVEFDQKRLDIIYEEGDESDRIESIKTPLFKDMYTKEEGEAKHNELAGSPIAVFHSYKGGVGRTLALISLVREISETHENQKKVLIVDADLEAPGLTWMLGQGKNNEKISYFDVLELLHFNSMDDNFVNNVARLVRTNVIKVMTERLEVEHYFLPVYREKSQMLNIYSSPEKIISVQKDKYVITEFLSRLGAALGTDLVLVDLRAGVTEFSAPFLFDARVDKFFISSTSMQSIMGTKLILDEIQRKVADGHLNSKLLLTMIPRDMDEDKVGSLEDELAESLEQDLDSESMNVLREDYLYRVPFDSAFASLGDFQEICALLKGKMLSDVMAKIAGGMLKTDAKADGTGEKPLSLENVKDTISRLHEITTMEITAEGSASSNMLATTSIREIVREFKDTVPQLVVLGAKGSGKTYIYKQLLSKRTWEKFADGVEASGERDRERTLILPLVCSLNMKKLHSMVQECIENCNHFFEEMSVRPDIVVGNYNKLASYAEKETSLTEWMEIWQRLMLDMLGAGYRDLGELDQYLEKKGRRILFIVDGLEDLFMDMQIQTRKTWRFAIRALCQNIVNTLRNLRFGNIGIVIFARKDMAEEAIEINFDQFQNQYHKYELKWSPSEALRLALWIAKQAAPALGEDVDILKASREVLEERLEKLWGKKLGRFDSREANSAKWIIAALSDFTNQLQARDIVRFLQFATSMFPEGKLPYEDRYIMPKQIREAIPGCSREKYKEIRDEMKAIYQILKKFEDMPEEEKVLPLTLDKISLTGEEIARLENQGYFIMSDKKYYFPEIIRFALEFKYVKGARPRGLSLLAR